MNNQTIFMLFFTFLFCSSIQGQNFGGVGQEWYYSGHNAAPPAYSGYVRFSHTGDTVLLGRPANLLLQQYYSYTGMAAGANLAIVAQASDTVYLYREDLAAFVVLYVFNGSAGDTILLDDPYDIPDIPDSVYRIVVDSVSMENYGGVSLKKYHTHPLDHFYWPGDLVDHIGCTGWFFPVSFLSIPEGPGDIRCFSSPEFSINFNTYSCDYHLNSATADIQNNFRVAIYPNPTGDRLNIASNEAVVSVRLTNQSGLVVLETDQNVIDMGTFPQGLYIVQVKTRSGSVHVSKISKI